MKKYLKKFKNFDPLTVVCVGDSTTSQEWVHPNWVDWLTFTFKQQDPWPKGLNRQIINSGRDGAIIPYYLDNFEQLVGRHEPDVVIVSLGFNHLEIETEDVDALLKKLLGRIIGIGAEVITWSTYDVIPKEVSQKLKKISEIYRQITESLDKGSYRELTEDFEGVFVDIYTEFNRYDLDMLFTYKSPDGNTDWKIEPGELDYLHCNEIGNQIIAEKIAREAFELELLEWRDFGTMKLEDLSKYLK